MAEGELQAGWYADPTGRFELRWWDGGRWTDQASRAGVVATDPLVPVATGPRAPAPLSDAAVVYCFAERLFPVDEGVRVYEGQRPVDKNRTIHLAWAMSLARVHDLGLVRLEIADHHVGPVHTHPLVAHVVDVAGIEQLDRRDGVNWLIEQLRKAGTARDGTPKPGGTKLRPHISELYKWRGDPWIHAHNNLASELFRHDVFVDTDPSSKLYAIDRDAAAALEPRLEELLQGWRAFEAREPALAAALVDEIAEGFAKTEKEYPSGSGRGWGVGS